MIFQCSIIAIIISMTKSSIFRDDNQWAILLEILAYYNHHDDLSGITTIASLFGNCLTGCNDNGNFNSFASDIGQWY